MSSPYAKFHFLLERGRFKEAEALIRAELAKQPNDGDLHLQLSQVLCLLDRPKDAVESARKAIGLEPDSGLPHEILAQALIKSSNWNGAEQAVRQATALDGDDADRRALLARISSERGKHEACLEHAEAGLAMDPDHEICRFFRGIGLGRLGRHQEADDAVLGLLRDDPEDSTNHSGRGWILLERNATDEAKLHFQEALRLDPENEDARRGLARCLQQGNPFLGWLLRAIIAIDRIPMMKVLFWVVLLGIVLPRFMRAEGRPPGLKLAAQVIHAGMMSFFYLSLVVQPLFHTLLFLSKEGRRALSRYELRAVGWSVLPMLAGLALLPLWIAGGSKSPPVGAVGLLCSSAMLYAGISTRHPWVRRRMLIIAAAVCACAAWFLLGPQWLLVPMVEEIKDHLAARGTGADSKELASELTDRLVAMLRVKNWAFTYPAMAVYLLTAFSSNVVEALKRRAPDDAD